LLPSTGRNQGGVTGKEVLWKQSLEGPSSERNLNVKSNSEKKKNHIETSKESAQVNPARPPRKTCVAKLGHRGGKRKTQRLEENEAKRTIGGESTLCVSNPVPLT